MKPLRLVFFCCVLSFCLGATEEPAPAPMKFALLELRDGRKLKNVVVKSYDAATDKVLLLVGGKAMVVPLEKIPAPFADQLKAGAPKSGETVSLPVVPPPPVTNSETSAVVKPRPMVMRPNTPAPGLAPAQPAVDPEAMAKEIAAHGKVAKERAEKYFRYEHQMGSNNISVSRLEFEFDESLPVDGWTGRFRTEGKAFVEFYDSKGNSFQRTTSAFEVITERKPGAAIKVENFNRKN